MSRVKPFLNFGKFYMESTKYKERRVVANLNFVFYKISPNCFKTNYSNYIPQKTFNSR